MGVWPPRHSAQALDREPRQPLGAAERFHWTAAGRNRDVGTVRRLLELHPAVLLTGARGSGKSELLTILATGQDAVRVPNPMPSRSAVARWWSRTLEQVRGGGRTPLLIVDDISTLRGQARADVMELLEAGSARALFTRHAASEEDPDCIRLAEAGLLALHELRPLRRPDLRDMVREATGAIMSETVTQLLMGMSEGNLTVAHAYFEELRTLGSLVRTQSCWVLNGTTEVREGGPLSRVVQGELSRVSPHLRVALQKLAVLGQAPRPLAERVVGAQALEELEAAGLVRWSGDAHRLLMPRAPHLAEALRLFSSDAHRTALLQDIASVAGEGLGDLDPDSLVSVARLATEGGVLFSAEAALQAARAANAALEPVLARRCLNGIPLDHELGAHAVLERVHALRVMGEYSRAAAEIEAVPEAILESAGLGLRAELALVHCGALIWLPGGYERIRRILGELDERIRKAAHAGSTGERELEHARRQARLGRWELGLHLGEFPAMVDGLEKAAATQDDPVYRLSASSLLVTAWVVVGREEEAIALAERIGGEIAETRLSLRLYEYYSEGLLLGLIWSGRNKLCLGFLEHIMETRPDATRLHGGVMELGLGLAHVYAGQGEEAIEILLSSVAQLGGQAYLGYLRVAHAALAFAYAQCNHEAEAIEQLALADACTAPEPWTNTALSTFCSLMARRWLGDAKASVQLVEGARLDVERGRPTTASISLFGALHYASGSDIELLAEVSAQRQGPMARINRLWARAILERDPVLACEAADGAAELGLRVVELRCVSTMAQLALERGLGRMAEEAGVRAARLRKPIDSGLLNATGDFGTLTQRELQVTRLAERGLSNKMIADRIGLSVRTVEGHLYQAFIKLGIRSREQLMFSHEGIRPSNAFVLRS
ncbi:MULTISPECIES: LuxR family transcriptional regulator [Arthrobacter]|uniref:LuxR C-terminal-related transcriptional regulator n=2 Tax=Arthrobacter TaxID=1663 RepID=A0ABU9KLT3_9MICC|nr:LuxR family transcriptional regulator [Arthrobacter sp. YJM1]MDP5227312.1 LuxR C-terminal-related transcriptional regulator [Arthrobacter sp. YJM1]